MSRARSMRGSKSYSMPLSSKHMCRRFAAYDFSGSGLSSWRPMLRRNAQAPIVGVLAMSRTICFMRLSGSPRSFASG